jgi:hypothetical protein
VLKRCLPTSALVCWRLWACLVAGTGPGSRTKLAGFLFNLLDEGCYHDSLVDVKLNRIFHIGFSR